MPSNRQRAVTASAPSQNAETHTLDRFMQVIALLLPQALSPHSLENEGHLHAGPNVDRVRSFDAFFVGAPDVENAARRSVFQQLQRWSEVRETACPRAIATMLWALARDSRASVRAQRGRFLAEVERQVFRAFASRREGGTIHRMERARRGLNSLPPARRMADTGGQASCSNAQRSRTG